MCNLTAFGRLTRHSFLVVSMSVLLTERSSLAQTPATLTPLSIAAGATDGVANRVSASGDWVMGNFTPAGGGFGLSVWNVPLSARLDFITTPAAISPATINESLSLVAANGVNKIYLVTPSGPIDVSAAFPPPFAVTQVIGSTENGRLFGFVGGNQRANPASMVIDNGVFRDLGLRVMTDLGVTFTSDVITDVATGRPTCVGYGSLANGTLVGYLHDLSTGQTARIATPTGGEAIPLAVSADGLNVTGVVFDPITGIPEAFRWHRRFSQLTGTFTGNWRWLGTLDPSNPSSFGTAIDANGTCVVGYSNVGTDLVSFVWIEQRSPLPQPPMIALFDELVVVRSVPPGPFVSLAIASDMSDRGSIVGQGIDAAQSMIPYVATIPSVGCRADLSGPFGLLDTNDILQFFTDFSLNMTSADYDYDGVLTPNDANEYITDWLAGSC